MGKVLTFEDFAKELSAEIRDGVRVKVMVFTVDLDRETAITILFNGRLWTSLAINHNARYDTVYADSTFGEGDVDDIVR